MATSHTLIPLFLTTTLLLILLCTDPLIVSADTAAQAPAVAPLNLTGILEKGGQYNTLLRLMKETQVGEQVTSQLNSSFDGITMFAPTDNAFNNLKPGTLNSLTSQDQVQLVLYHILPRYYSLTTFETASNPLRTQASGNNGMYTVNVTSASNSANVSTGVDQVPINNALYSEFPLAVYSVDQVLLPFEMFGVNPPAPAPAPMEVVPKKKKKPALKGSPPSNVAAAPATAEADSTNSAAGGPKGRVCWGVPAVVGLMGVLNVFLV